MGTVEGGAADWVGRWWRDGAAARHAPALAGALLGVAALAELIVRQAGTAALGPYVLLLCLLGLAATAPLALADPVAAAATVSAANLLGLAALHAPTVAGAAAQVLVAYRLGRRGWPPGAVALGVPYLAVALTDPAGAYVRAAAVALASLVPVAAGAGIAVRIQREDAEHRAARHAIAGTLLEHTARGERARIARELHDVVAHHVSMIAVQAETARLTTPGLPTEGARRLSAIGDTARAALTEMRRLLGVLREDSREGADPGPQRHPQPGLRQLTDLIDEARDATGAGTRLILRGSPTSLDPGVELAAYRIVQEALTNSRRHAPGAAVDVELHYADDELRLLVRDNGAGPAAQARTTGHGLLGMRERATAVGGRLYTGRSGTGGFLVEAVLPTGASDLR
ncbi:sensor histidine kinase [Rugosimonospora acidiphila]|uniref:sensor histidine kinase n=1 Tax=Rugosimonospora acidiphila TaxID=556531 RepID=UPI0031E5C028